MNAHIHVVGCSGRCVDAGEKEGGLKEDHAMSRIKRESGDTVHEECLPGYILFFTHLLWRCELLQRLSVGLSMSCLPSHCTPLERRTHAEYAESNTTGGSPEEDTTILRHAAMLLCGKSDAHSALSLIPFLPNAIGEDNSLSNAVLPYPDVFHSFRSVEEALRLRCANHPKFGHTHYFDVIVATDGASFEYILHYFSLRHQRQSQALCGVKRTRNGEWDDGRSRAGRHEPSRSPIVVIYPRSASGSGGARHEGNRALESRTSMEVEDDMGVGQDISHCAYAVQQLLEMVFVDKDPLNKDQTHSPVSGAAHVSDEEYDATNARFNTQWREKVESASSFLSPLLSVDFTVALV